MSYQDLINNNVYFFFTVQLTVKLYHWNTTSFSRHKATDDLLDSLTSGIDKYIEVFIGKYKVKPLIENIKIKSEYLSDSGIIKLLELFQNYLEKLTIRVNASVSIEKSALKGVTRATPVPINDCILRFYFV